MSRPGPAGPTEAAGTPTPLVSTPERVSLIVESSIFDVCIRNLNEGGFSLVGSSSRRLGHQSLANVLPRVPQEVHSDRPASEPVVHRYPRLVARLPVVDL